MWRMNQKDKEQQYGHLVLTIRDRGGELAYVLVRAQIIGDQLSATALQFQRQFGIHKIGNEYTGLELGEVFQVTIPNDLERIADEARSLYEEIQQLYRMRQQLDRP